MDLDTLGTFIEVMRRGSFAAVARERNLDPSSVSRTIAGLERELGVRLFNRTTRQLSPTEAALAYFDRLEPLIDELARATQMASDSAEKPHGTLRITAPVSFAQVNLVPLLPDFARRYPEVDFELVLTDKFLDLVEERIDVALRLGRINESSLIAHRLCDMVNVVCASPDYLRKRGRPKTPADLEHHDCLHYPLPGYGPKWRFRQGNGAILEVPIHARVAAANGMALRQCAVAGMGILMLPRWNVAAELRSGALLDVLPEHQVTGSEFGLGAWMLYPSRSYLPRKVRAFADYLKEKFKHGPPAEEGLGAAASSRKRPRTPVR